MTAVAPSSLPDGLLLAFYGDDFTGSTDAMDAMTAAGIPTMLFLEEPTADMLARFPHVKCVGLAGASRGKDVAWMEEALPKAFQMLWNLGAPLLHYKVCSTFDSSPDIGSIGKAIDIGARVVGGTWVPLIVGAPRLKRYQVFGNLFAAVDGQCFRLDRHPTMSRHPVTPMGESDLRRHLAKQTDREIALIDVVQLAQDTETREPWQSKDVPAVFIDVMDDASLVAAGKLVWDRRGQGTFTASSSGLQYALAAYWRQRGWLPVHHDQPAAAPVGVIAGVSGSCSPVTGRQLEWAERNGFKTVRLDVAAILDNSRADSEIEKAVSAALGAISRSVSPIIYSAKGPDDPAVANFDDMASQAGRSRREAATRIGHALAEVMRRLLDGSDRSRLNRIVVAGGDSSGEVTSALGIKALTVQAALSPGAPICRAWSNSQERDGLEIVLKGGQMGSEQFFQDVLDGSERHRVRNAALIPS